MKKSIGFQLIVYSLLLCGLGYFTYHVSPGIALPTFITSLAGSALGLVWGIRAVKGSGGKALPILTLILVNYVMLSQTVIAWGGGFQEMPGRRSATLLITALFALSMGMLLRIVYTGAVFDGQAANPGKTGESKPQTAGKP